MERRDLHGLGWRLVEARGGRWTVHGGMCRCPAHDDRTPSLSIRPGRERLLVHCFAGCATEIVLRLLAEQHASVLTACGAPPAEEQAWREPASLRLWREARDLPGTPAQRYLAGRGLDRAPPDLRYHPRVPHGPAPATRFRPAMVAAVRDGGGLVAVHRTFLSADRPPLVGGRAALGRLGGGAVRLVPPVAGTLGLAEGIETALSASKLFGIPCWATLGSERFGRVALPPGITRLVLFLDHDRAGHQGEARALAAYGDNRHVEVFRPEQPGDDWNDVLRRSML